MLKKYLLALIIAFGFAGLTACSSGSSGGETEAVDLSEGIDDALDDELLDEELVGDLSEETLDSGDLLDSSFDTDIVEETIEDSIPDIEVPIEVADGGSEIFDNPDIFGDESVITEPVSDIAETITVPTEAPIEIADAGMDLFEETETITVPTDSGNAEFFEETTTSYADTVPMAETYPVTTSNDSAIFESEAPQSYANNNYNDSDFFESGQSLYSDAGYNSNYTDGGQAYFLEDGGARSWTPVKKMKEAPFYRGNQLANTLYVVREGDTMRSISQKIYGMDKSSDLLAINTTLSRGIKVGDKVYYNSPRRINDESRMITFYEDVGMAPEFYVTSSGENIRSASKKLLGHSGSWKEVWATNPDIESKWDVAQGTTLKYWADASNISTVASAPQPPQESMAERMAKKAADAAAEAARKAKEMAENSAANMGDAIETAKNDMADGAANMVDGAKDMAANGADAIKQEVLPEEEPIEVAANEEIPPPPGFGTVDSTPPPPPAPPARKRIDRKKVADAPEINKRKVAKASSKNQTMAIGALGILLLGAAMLIFLIRRRRKTDVSYATQTHTHIE